MYGEGVYVRSLLQVKVKARTKVEKGGRAEGARSGVPAKTNFIFFFVIDHLCSNKKKMVRVRCFVCLCVRPVCFVH